MAKILLEVNTPLTAQEQDEIRRFLEPMIVATQEQTELSFLPPPAASATEGVGLQHSLGIDPTTILVVALASGATSFLTKLTQEMAVDFWKGIKKILSARSERRKAIPVNSVQIQMSADKSRGLSVVVCTWFNTRFVSESRMAELARAWQEQLSSRIGANEQTKPENPADDHPIILHAVINGTADPVWHVVPGRTDTSAQRQ